MASRAGRTFTLTCLVGGLFVAACYSEPGPRERDDLEPSSGGATASGGAASSSDGGDFGSMGGTLGAESGGMGSNASSAGGIDSGGTGGTDTPQAPCDEVVGEPLPARLRITSEDAPQVVQAQFISVTKASLFRDFEEQTCGNPSCHGGGDDPLAASPLPFKMTLNSFNQRPTLGDESWARITSSDPAEVMPPGSGDGSQRGESDPVLRLGERLKRWQELGFPETFEIVVESAEPNEELPAEHPYLMQPELGESLTNIGSCVPGALSVSSPLMQASEMEEKDALFAAAEDSDDLPDTLVETDIVSLDSSVLAHRGVYSYAPTYTLFSDHAGKMRHVRVPLGKTIRYNPETRDFDIPDNTRFYKTFLKQVKDEDGEIGWRKMETRLIVVRRDEALPGGGFRPRALRTSYAWDRDETMAFRLKDPLRNGEPFADRLCPYVVDESVERDPATNPVSDDMSEFCGYMTPDELADPNSGQIRHYAIPSTERCDQCHMGSNNRSYILGFNPWQVDRRPAGEGGIYEDPTEDELSQLARLIEYGVVSGIEPGEAKLEESQGERKPRNEFELKAQGYMMGNCVFCHNPNGFPVVQNPVLADFNMFPDHDTGGIFQFSLERYSPRAKAGQTQSVRFPYITPGFGDHDLLALAAANSAEDHEKKEVNWGFPDDPPVIDADERPVDYADRWEEIEGSREFLGRFFTFLGPWRSLIWRNVYTPFTYDEDYTIFVHMPRNAPGYDCRAHQIMADWMLSIPSHAKPLEGKQPSDPSFHQPYVEVLPGEDGYTNAARQASKRVEDYHRSVTGQHCPTDDDIIDPQVVLSPVFSSTGKKTRPSPLDDGLLNSERLAQDLPQALLDAVPDHAHWVPTDTSDNLERWVPRRLNWEEVLTKQVEADNEKVARVVDQLQSVHLSDAQKQFSLEPVPMGPWAPECQASSVASESPTVAELLESPNEPMRRWLRGVTQNDDQPDADTRVHFQSRGAAVFQAICQNCHGRQADSRSPLAATILELTGAQTRVANFIDGLFGPADAPGAFAREEFLINQGASAQDWQARYLLFMGLGGTQADLPRSVLDLVATSPFYGKAATAPGGQDPNMLDSAYQRCRQILVNRWEMTELKFAGLSTKPLRIALTGSDFVSGTAHYELWESLCKYGNEPFVRVFDGNQPLRPEANVTSGVYRAEDAEGNSVYPPDHPVGNQHGAIENGINGDNTFPWCIEVTNDDQRVALIQAFGKWSVSEEQVPFCPASLLAEVLGERLHKFAITENEVDYEAPFGNAEFTERWLLRGAMNAGIAAFYYLDELIPGRIQPSQPFDSCQE
ncbi:MAG TPA: hypothetical protein VFU02_14560 [Polyangiaceae bacterium]|nr:hypothetical protein [Polyangiaceae bacterium]